MSINPLLSLSLEPTLIKQWPHHFNKTVLTGISLDAPFHPPFFSWILRHTPPNFSNTLLATIGQVYESVFAAETTVLISQ